MPTNLIIDGHGTDLQTTFNFQRAAGNECTLYSYVRAGISIPSNQSDNIITKIVNNDFSKEITTSNASRIGGTQLTDRLLGAIRVDAHGTPEWDNDALFPAGAVANININGTGVTQITSGANIYLRLPFGAANTIKLSDVIAHYNAGQYNFFWCVCR
jgi:hypothetical protein